MGTIQTSFAASQMMGLPLGVFLSNRWGWHAPFIMIFALVTPWLFEVAHVVIEVALYPFALSLFLLCVHRAAGKPKWRTSEIIPIALALALLTYTYSIGRLLAPLLALGLVLFGRASVGQGSSLPGAPTA